MQIHRVLIWSIPEFKVRRDRFYESVASKSSWVFRSANLHTDHPLFIADWCGGNADDVYVLP